MFRLGFKYSCLVLIAAIVYSVSANAESPFSITVDPPSIKSSALPGNSTSKYITVENTSNLPISIKIYAQDWEYLPDGSKSFLKLGSSKVSLINNIQLFANQIFLKPKSTQSVVVKITSPKNYKGGLYSVVFFEGAPTSTSANGAKANVKLVGRVGTIIYHEVEGTVTHNLSATINAQLSSTSTQNILVSVTNKGNVVEFDPINLLIVSDGKKVVDRIPLPDIKLMPGDKRDVSVSPSIQLKAGKYSAIVSFQTLAGPQFSNSDLVVK